MVAQEAARIIVNQGIRDYGLAKKKAAGLQQVTSYWTVWILFEKHYHIRTTRQNAHVPGCLRFNTILAWGHFSHCHT